MLCPRCHQPATSADNGRAWYCVPCQALVGDGDRQQAVKPGAAVRGACAAETVSPGGVVSVTLELPLPPRGCSPNNSGQSSHWRVREGARAVYRTECWNLLPPLVCGRLFDAATISTEWFLGAATGRYHPQDEQNAIASLKGVCDSLVDRGYVPDDNAKVFHWGATVLRPARESGGRALVRVTLTRRETNG